MDETVDLLYVADLALYQIEKPYYISKELPLGLPESNIEYERHSEQLITDIRGREHEFALDDNGFAYYRWVPPEVDWKDEEDIQGKYLPAVKNLVQEILGGKLKRCEIFDWRMRSAVGQSTLQDLNGEENEKLRKIAPAFIVHVDQSPQGVIDYMRRVFGEEAEKLLEDRVRLVNVWLPLVDVIEDNSLAVCDAKSADPKNFLAVDAVGQTLVREILMAKYSDEFRFYYLSQMTKCDVCIFKVWDSDPNVRAKFVPHCSFNHSKYLAPNAQPRESIECRVLTIADY